MKYKKLRESAMKKRYKKCEVCGNQTKTTALRRAFNQTLCMSHYHQMKKFGKIVRKEGGQHGMYITSRKISKIKKLLKYCIIQVPYKGEIYNVKIDKEDYNKCNNYTWVMNAHKSISTHYKHENGKSVRVSLHRLVMGDPQNYYVRHITKDLLDCRKSNLEKIPKNKPNIFSGRGISWTSDLKKWDVRIHLGKYRDLEKAKKVRDFIYNQYEEYKKNNNI